MKPSWRALAVSSLGLMSPVVATIMGVVFLGQTFTPIQLMGMAIMLVSVFLGQERN